MYIYESRLSDVPPPPKPTLVDELKKYIKEKGSSEVEKRIEEERVNLGRTVVIISENHSGATRSVDLARRLMKNDVFRFIASEFFQNAGEYRTEIRSFLRGLRTSLGEHLCPYESLLTDLKRKPRFILFVGSRRRESNTRDWRISKHFIEEHADRKLNRATPGVLVCGSIHGARMEMKGQHRTTRRRLEDAGFRILGALLSTDDIDGATQEKHKVDFRTDTVWPVGETKREDNAIRLLDLVSTNDEYTVIPTKGSPFDRVSDVWSGDSSSVSIAERFELVILARSMKRCTR